jgi:hypothetical protein
LPGHVTVASGSEAAVWLLVVQEAEGGTGDMRFALRVSSKQPFRGAVCTRDCGILSLFSRNLRVWNTKVSKCGTM